MQDKNVSGERKRKRRRLPRLYRAYVELELFVMADSGKEAKAVATAMAPREFFPAEQLVKVKEITREAQIPPGWRRALPWEGNNYYGYVEGERFDLEDLSCLRVFRYLKAIRNKQGNWYEE